MLPYLTDVTRAFFSGYHSFDQPKSSDDCVKEEKDIREHLSEAELDKMVADSFPASDPPSTY